MNVERHKLIDEFYTRALELPAAEREAYVRDHCDDARVKAEVMALLAAATSDRLDLQFDSIRERMLGEVVRETGAAEDPLPGQRIGYWRIERRLARGGLATVYVAHRDDGEYDQRVAFKVLRRGLDTEDLVARFRNERQILSSLDHPGIARILDGGALPDGRPFLVLEFVDGRPITDYCDAESIDVRGRVRLVIDVLRALHDAHKHLVVHRDIKPSNILVSSEGRIALLDFGIAKLLDPAALPGTSTLTRTGVSLLTPGYGSPEQHAGEAVTTASDIYQVGVVLYELLTGRRPALSRDDLAVPAPSTLLKGTQRFGHVRGDLDAIVLKAMHSEPGRRYAAASEMVADLERYLDGRPVAAQPDTLAYRLHKLMKRRPWLLPVAAVFVVGIAAYVVTLTLYSNRLRLEQRRSEAAQTFMVDLLRSPDPFAPADPERGRNITVLEALEIGRDRLEHELGGQPELKATLLGSVAGVYQSLDQSAEAIELGEQALALNLQLYGEASEPVLENLRLLADRYDTTGDYDRAREYFDRQLAIARRLYATDDPRLGIAEVASGTFEKAQGNLDAGVGLMVSGIDKLRAEPEEHAEILIDAIAESTDQDGMNDPRESLRLLEEALDVAQKVYGPESLYAASVYIAIGRNALFVKDYPRSKENYEHGLAIFEARLGRAHGATITHLQDYGVMLMNVGDYAGAEAIHRELVDRLIALHGEDHRSVADNYQNLASAIARQGRFAEALPLHRRAYEIYNSVLEEDHYIVAFPLLSIAYIELQRNDAAAAEEAAAKALDTFRATLPGTYLEGVALCLTGLARERRGDSQGTAMVLASHELIGQQINLQGSPYLKLCRMPEGE